MMATPIANSLIFLRMLLLQQALLRNRVILFNGAVLVSHRLVYTQAIQ
jgi:hypothetical protein